MKKDAEAGGVSGGRFGARGSSCGRTRRGGEKRNLKEKGQRVKSLGKFGNSVGEKGVGKGL